MANEKKAAIAIATGIVALVAACGGGDSETGAMTGGGGGAGGSITHQGGSGGTEPTGPGSGGSGGDASGGSGGGGCQRTPAPADGVRTVVVSHPFADIMGNKSPKYEALTLGTDGTLTFTHETFSLGVSTGGEMAFTPDGKIGIVPDEDGNLGVVSFDDQHHPTVVDAKFHGSFYATAVYVEPGGATALVLDFDTRDNGGGVYRVGIGCDGKLKDLGKIAPAKLPGGFAWLSDQKRGVLAAGDALGSMVQGGAELLQIGTPPTLLGSANVFGDDEAIESAVATTHDDKFAIVADDSQASDTSARLGVVKIGASTIAPLQVLQASDTMITDPADVVTSPFDNAALVLSAFDDTIFVLGYDPTSATAPISVRGPLAYVGRNSGLPTVAVPVTRGTLNGLVVIVESAGLRRVRFEKDGDVTDLGLTQFGSDDDVTNAIGSLGIAP